MTIPSEERIGYVLSRYLAAALLLLYGFAKLTGAQFTVLDSELDKPLRDVSGFWLTWYYFGYSQAYGAIVAVVQIGGAIALLIRRMALIGACILAPVIANILLIDLFYAISPGALAAAVVIALCLIRILVAHRSQIQQLLLPPMAETSMRRSAIAAAAAVAMVLIAFLWTYYIAHYNNRRPTPIDGTWVVATTAGGSSRLPTHVYFERNRAFMCVFRYADGSSTHHFEVGPERTAVRIWTHWLTRGSLLMEGVYDPVNHRLVLSGNLPGVPQPVKLMLSKQRGPGS